MARRFEFLGIPLTWWLVILVILVFGSYITKNIYAGFYKLATGRDIDPSYFTTGRWGKPDYSYATGKAIVHRVTDAL